MNFDARKKENVTEDGCTRLTRLIQERANSGEIISNDLK